MEYSNHVSTSRYETSNVLMARPRKMRVVSMAFRRALNKPLGGILFRLDLRFAGLAMMAIGVIGPPWLVQNFHTLFANAMPQKRRHKMELSLRVLNTVAIGNMHTSMKTASG